MLNTNGRGGVKSGNIPSVRVHGLVSLRHGLREKAARCCHAQIPGHGRVPLVHQPLFRPGDVAPAVGASDVWIVGIVRQELRGLLAGQDPALGCCE
jgi:hypothetical protein